MNTMKSTVVRFSRVELAALLAVVSVQSRVKINPSVVSEYAEGMKRGEKFPPLIVYKDTDGQLYLADGYHRASAAIEADLKGFNVEVRQGSEWDALLFSVGANGAHGLRPTNADKRKAVTLLLKHPSCRKWADSKIAKHCLVSGAYVGNVRDELAVDDPEIATTEREYERNGKVGTQKTGNIGKSKAPKKKPAVKSVKEVVVTEKVEALDRSVSEQVVPAETSEWASPSEAVDTTGDDLIEAMDAQVIDAGTVDVDKDEQTPPSATTNGTAQRYSDRFEVVLGSQESFENSEGIFIVFGRKKDLMLDLIRDTCMENGATVFATPNAAVAWKFQNMTDKERRALAKESSL